MKRLFLALPLPPLLKKPASEYLKAAAENLSGVRWADSSGLHLTLHFFGEVNTERMPAIQRAAGSAASSVRPFSLGLSGLGFFPGSSQPEVIWAAPFGDLESLKKLQTQLCFNLKSENFDLESRPFHPHVTLGRVKAGLKEDVFAAFDFPKTTKAVISEMALFESCSTSAGPRYEILEKFPFA